MNNLSYSILNGVLVYIITVLFNRYLYYGLIYESIMKPSFLSINIALVISLIILWVFLRYKLISLKETFKISLISGLMYIICSWIAILFVDVGIIDVGMRFLIGYSMPFLRSLLLGVYFILMYSLLTNLLNKSIRF